MSDRNSSTRWDERDRQALCPSSANTDRILQCCLASEDEIDSQNLFFCMKILSLTIHNIFKLLLFHCHSYIVHSLATRMAGSKNLPHSRIQLPTKGSDYCGWAESKVGNPTE